VPWANKSGMDAVRLPSSHSPSYTH
jgi:hypothetical protein